MTYAYLVGRVCPRLGRRGQASVRPRSTPEYTFKSVFESDADVRLESETTLVVSDSSAKYDSSSSSSSSSSLYEAPALAILLFLACAPGPGSWPGRICLGPPALPGPMTLGRRLPALLSCPALCGNCSAVALMGVLPKPPTPNMPSAKPLGVFVLSAPLPMPENILPPPPPGGAPSAE
jgi:hypothetical protein